MTDNQQITQFTELPIMDEKCTGTYITQRPKIIYDTIDGTIHRKSVRIPAAKRPSALEPGQIPIIWHYTTLDVLESILKTNSIWASSLNSQNDTQEFSYGIELFHSEATKLYESRFISPKTKELVRDAIRTVDKIDITHCFSISACLERDSTKLWSSYADVIDPVSIGFSAYAALTPRQHPATHKANDFFKGEWRKVIYDINQQRIFISEIFGLIDEMHNREENPVIYRKKLHTVSQTILCVIAFLKSPDFSHEEEVRCVFLNEKDGILYRNGAYGNTPYIEVISSYATDDNTKHERHNESLLPIVSIVVGNSINDNIQKIKQLLNRYGYTHVTAEKTNCHLRAKMG